MPVGLTASLTKGQIDSQAGLIAQRLNVVMEDCDDLAFFEKGVQDAELAALGYTADDILTFRTAVREMDQLRRIYQGLEALAEAKDFRTFVSRIWGTGIP